MFRHQGIHLSRSGALTIMRKIKHVLCVVAGLALVAYNPASSAADSLVTYSDYSSWSAAVPDVTTVVIPDPPGGYINFGQGNQSVMYSGVVFSASAALGNGKFYVIGSTYKTAPYALNDQQRSTGVSNILISFPSAVTGFALDFGTWDSGGTPVTFLLSNEDTFTKIGHLTYNYSTPDFAGATDDPFTWVLVTTSSYALTITNVSYSATPEPSDLTLLGSLTVLGGAVYLRRRRAKA